MIASHYILIIITGRALAASNVTPPVAIAPSDASRKRSAAEIQDEESIASGGGVEDELCLPHVVVPWTDSKMEERISIVICMLGGCYHWKVSVEDNKRVLVIRINMPKTLTAKAMAKADQHNNEKDAALREQAIKVALAERKANAKALVWLTMKIELPKEVLQQPREFWMVELPGKKEDLGEEFEGCPYKHYDRYLCVELDVPNKKFAVKRAKKTKFFTDEDDIASLDESEEET